ncbi:MAG: glycosyltransferase family 2 protein [Muribaculaceae bacterium]|nr:glycosyltransferase family 2 protein [Muribaculaceae bacterium]
MNGPLITVFTPAFNRAHTIWRTYQSLCRQTCKDFIWMVIDDGSTDNTAELVLKWKENSKFEIIYIYQQNQGMHGAHNTAYQNITTELNVCIDSDDYMPDDAIELITKFWRNNGSEKYAGIIGLDVDLNQQIIGTEFPNNLKETTLTDFYANGGKGDKKLVYRTEVIKKYPEYPIFDKEKYVGLAYKYMLIDQNYTLLTINRPLVVVEYQQDGSSNNMLRQYWNNPKGFAFYRKTEMVLAPTLKRRFMSCIHYVSSSIISKNKNFIKESPKKLLTILSILPGFGLFLYIKFKIKQ